MPNKFYIGDSVYLTINQHQLVLTTENGLPTDPSNRIYLEWDVYENLVAYVEAVKREHERHSKEESDV